MDMTRGQQLAVEQIIAIESSGEGVLEVVGIKQSKSQSKNILIDISIYCKNIPKTNGGISLRNRERFLVSTPPDFPFDIPSVNTLHKRFAGHPHVQWGQHLCLYISSNTEWDSTDGMFGFIIRLDNWLRKASTGELDPTGGPLHPPVAYTSVYLHKSA